MADEEAATPAGGSESAKTSAKTASSTRNSASGDKSADSPGVLSYLKDKLTIPRSATPYFAAALLAAMAMGWYFFVFVPQKLEYFVGLRFRALAVASGQIKGKAESLGLSLSSAPPPPRSTAATDQAPTDADPQVQPFDPAEPDPEKYLRLLVPDLRLNAAGRPVTGGLQLAVSRTTQTPNPTVAKPVESLSATVAWERVALQGAVASAAEFDDLALADKSGTVVWQREKTTPRLGTLTELLYADDDKGTWISRSWAIRTVLPAVDAKKGLPETVALKAVRIGATSTLMLVQTIHLDSPYITSESQKTLYVAGFVSSQRLQRQARRIPLVWIVVVSVPIAVLFLALPFIKLATMNSKERFSAANLVLMAIGAVAASGLAAVIPLGPRSVTREGDRALTQIAALVDDHLRHETKAVLALAKTIADLGDKSKALASCVVPIKVGLESDAHCDLWDRWDGLVTDGTLPPVELDVAIWLDDRGYQLQKWTTKSQLTGQSPHRAYEHFRSLTSNNLWQLADMGATRFTIEPLRAPTTADLGVVFGMWLQELRAGPPEFRWQLDPKFLILNVRPHAVVDAVMPPGYGFAIIASDGKVLFHSNDGLSLEENFLEEVSDPQGVRERLLTERPVTWSGDYHGTPHRIHMQAIAAFAGCPWKIVTFQDLNPALAAIVEHQSGTFRLSMLNLALLLAVLALTGWLYTRRRGGNFRDLLADPRSPSPQVLYVLPVLIVLGSVALAVTGSPSGHEWTDVLGAVFALLPFLAIATSICARLFGPTSDAAHGEWLVRLEVVMLLVLIGVLPAAGFARIVQRVQNVQSTERWLEFAHQRTVAHAKRVRARAVSPAYSEKTRHALAHTALFQGGTNGSHFYVQGSPVLVDDRDTTCADLPETGQAIVRRILQWSIFPADRQGDTPVKACAGTSRLKVDGEGIVLVGDVWPDGRRTTVRDRRAPGNSSEAVGSSRGEPDDSKPSDGSIGAGLFEAPERGVSWLIAAAIFAGTVVAAYWARRRLTTPKAPATPGFPEALGLLARDGNQGFMLIGPPRARKDRMISKVIVARMKFPDLSPDTDPIYRIKLLDKTIDEKFLTSTLKSVAEWLKQPAMLDSERRLWIHVSNLESQLTDAESRTGVLKLLEMLLDRSPDEPSKVIVVTTSIDPIAHFHEIFTTERKGIYDDAIPEVQLSRSSLVLSRFMRCYLPIHASRREDPWWDYKPAAWSSVLKWEAAAYPPLVQVAKAIKRSRLKSFGTDQEVPRTALARAFRNQALATYDLLWASCTRCEKIVLVQLAQEGFVTTRNCEVVWSLMHKGFIVDRPRPAIFNDSFRQFLRGIERDHIVEEWEREDGNGLWLVAARLIGSSLIAGGLFYLTTQDFSVDSLLPVVSGTGVFGAPVVRALLARMTMRAAGAGVVA